VRLLFDLIPLQKGFLNGYEGGAEYVLAVLKALLQRTSTKDVFFLLDENVGGQAEVLRLLDTLSGNEDLRHLVKIAALSDLPDLLLKQGIDTFFSGLAYDWGRVSWPPRVRKIFTVHGLRSLECPTDTWEPLYAKNLKNWLRIQLNRVRHCHEYEKDSKRFEKLFATVTGQDRVVLVSDHTTWAVQNLFHVKKYSMVTLYSPCKVSKPPRWTENQPAPGNFLLLLNADRWLKNGYRATMAFDDLVSREKSRLGDLKLVVLGGLPPRIRRRLKNLDSFVFFPYLPAESLEYLYAHARALFFPSLNEGFGYPPLEAMKYGTPVLCSAVTSLPEILGEAALYFSPFSLLEMQTRILEILDPSVHREKSQASLKRQELVRKRQERDLNALCDLLLSSKSSSLAWSSAKQYSFALSAAL
jgi:glycosyltransferase involved in cell wall biosynthesis